MGTKRVVWMCVLAALVVATGSTFGAQGPAQINYQGVLRDAVGRPRAGSFDMVFRFYDALTGGNEILVDRHEAAGTGAVTVTTGMFSAALGGGTVQDGSGPGTYASLRDVFAQFGSVYLEVTIAGETLIPRTQVLSSAFAIANPGADGPCFDNSNRFVDCGNGTVTDTQTGLIWLKKADCFSLRWFDQANNAASGLHSGQCGLTDGSPAGAWRLPTQAEWTAVVKASCSPPTLPDLAGTGCFATGTPWATGVTTNTYWSSTTCSSVFCSNNPIYGSSANLSTGNVGYGIKSSPYYVWPVRSGP